MPACVVKNVGVFVQLGWFGWFISFVCHADSIV